MTRAASTRLVLPLLAAVLAAARADAQTFGPGQTIVGGQVNGPANVSAPDLDGDGDADVLCPMSGNQRVVWYENLDGLGSLGAQKIITTDVNLPTSASAADLDGDGDLDVLSTNYNWHEVVWYENTDGLGSFGPKRFVAVGTFWPSDSIAADLDGDGDLDVVSASDLGDEILWFENTDGLGTFGAARTITNANTFSSLFAADVDGDGDQDLLATGSNAVVWFENADGLGAFGEPQLIADVLAGFHVRAADLDGDGDQDALTASWADDTVAWYENTDGLGAFGPKLVIDGQADSAASVFAADVDGDGDRDVLSAARNDHTVSWYRNIDGPSIFSTGIPIATGFVRANSVVAVDLDADGDRDVVATAQDDGIATHENLNGLGIFGPGTNVVAALPEAVDAADFDGDGDLDPLSASIGDGKIAWYENRLNTGGPFGNTAISIPSYGVFSAAAADVDGDGDPDVLAVSGGLDWYENTDGLASFGASQAISTQAAFNRTAVSADLDGDGDLDVLSGATVLVAFAASPQIEWYENVDGFGSFGPQQIVTTDLAGASMVSAADLSGDGEQDVLAALLTDGEVVWYENAGSAASFTTEKVITTALFGPTDALAADLDGDGDADVMASSQSDDTIAWHENTDGLGTFGAQQVVTTAVDFPDSIVATDLGGDGDLDLLFTAFVGDTVGWFENTDGLGAFGPENVVSTQFDGPTSAVAADLDGDGDEDLLSSSYFDSTIGWFENTACPTVAPAAEVVRLGSPPNPAALLPGVSGPPVLGTTWDPIIDHTGFVPGATLDVLVVSGAAVNVPLAFGTLLCDVAGSPIFVTATPGASFSLPLPFQCPLVGASACSQGASASPTEIRLTNALDLTLGTF